MSKIIIVTHGPLADALKESSRMFFGDAVESLETIGLFSNESPEELKDKIITKINEMDSGSGILIFVDIFAGSPFNMVALAIDEVKESHLIECFTGVNMPLLMEALSCAETMGLKELKKHLSEISKDTIIDLRNALKI